MYLKIEKGGFMKIPSISNLNLFRTKQVNTINQSQNNPFAQSFNGDLRSDVFQSSNLNANSNPFVETTANIMKSITSTMQKVKDYSKDAFAPVISFAGNVKRIATMDIGELGHAIKKEISMIGVDSEVKSYMRRPVNELRDLLTLELNG